MKVALYFDNSVGLSVRPLVDLLNSVCGTIRFSEGKTPFRILRGHIEYPDTHEAFSETLKKEIEAADYAILGTMVAYDNNYFYEEHKNVIIISFHGWHYYTDLPISNGFFYFIAAMICEYLNIGETHEKNRGCLNDFWWDKRGVDAGMRAAFLCADCINSYKSGNPKLSELRDVENLLDLVSKASRKGEDVLWSSSPLSSAAPSGQAKKFDLFVSHNSADKPRVREIVRRLQSAGIKTWFDEENLEIGYPWQVQLEKQISQIAAGAIFVGEAGFSPWHDIEMRAFLAELMNRGCPVIPIILPDAAEVPELPLFLRQIMWIDMRVDVNDGILKLIRALRSGT